jgi:hypothetical protein
MSDTRDLASVLAAAERAAAAGDFPGAEALLREAAGRQEAELGPRHPELAHTLNNLGVVYERLNRPADAERCYRRARAIAAAALPPDHPFVLTSERNLREFCEARGLPVDASVPPSAVEPASLSAGAAAAPPAGARPLPGRVAAAGEQAEVAAPAGVGAVRPAAGRPQAGRGFPRRPAMALAGAGAVGLVLLLALSTRWCRDSREPDESATRLSSAGRAAPARPGTGADAAPSSRDQVAEIRPSGPAGESAARPREGLASPGGGPTGAGERSASRAEAARAPDERAAPSGERRPAAEGRPRASGEAGSRPRERAGPPVTPSVPPDRPRRATPPGSGGTRPGPSRPDLPAVLEARLCTSLSAATWRCQPAHSPVKSGPLVFYTRVRAARTTTVHHRWYAGDRVRQAVALRIRAGGVAGFRTYSRARVHPVGGVWRVELRAQDGTLLHEERFEVR